MPLVVNVLRARKGEAGRCGAWEATEACPRHAVGGAAVSARARPLSWHPKPPHLVVLELAPVVDN